MILGSTAIPASAWVATENAKSLSNGASQSQLSCRKHYRWFTDLNAKVQANPASPPSGDMFTLRWRDHSRLPKHRAAATEPRAPLPKRKVAFREKPQGRAAPVV
jgi:hypothetical protein